MSKQSGESRPNGQSSKSTNPERSYRIVQQPAKTGSISDQQARDAARSVKQHRANPPSR